MAALDADWVGYEAMQKDFRDQPKYGNNIPEVDELINKFYQLHADTCLSLPCVYGASLEPNAISISAHQPGGAKRRSHPGGCVSVSGSRDGCPWTSRRLPECDARSAGRLSGNPDEYEIPSDSIEDGG